ncbi:MAG: hypothetical protein AB7I41_09845 [Candidatus Sericytochromatia bacterium]
MKARRWLIAGLVLVGLGGVAFVAAPRLLMRAATEKPVAESTFVTRPAAAPDLRSQMSQALQNSQTHPAGQTAPFPPVSGQTQSVPAPDTNNTSTQAFTPEQPGSDAVIAATQPPAQAQSNPGSMPLVSQSQVPGQPPPAQQGQSAGSTQPGEFQLQIRENEIASMIYNGLYNGTAPEYRPSIQGVSVQLQGGKGRITVALIPKYLPEQFAKSLPGVSKDTPTIYLGGEVGLSLSNNTVSPEIYSLSLGSLRIPAPFIKAMVKQQVQQHVRQMTQLDSGQQAIFDSVDIDHGAISIRGHVQ